MRTGIVAVPGHLVNRSGTLTLRAPYRRPWHRLSCSPGRLPRHPICSSEPPSAVRPRGGPAMGSPRSTSFVGFQTTFIGVRQLATVSGLCSPAEQEAPGGGWHVVVRTRATTPGPAAQTNAGCDAERADGLRVNPGLRPHPRRRRALRPLGQARSYGCRGMYLAMVTSRRYSRRCSCPSQWSRPLPRVL